MSDFEFEYEGRQYAFDLEDVNFEQAMTIQREVDLTLGEFYDMASGGGRPGDSRFIHALLWLGKQHAGEACRFDDLKSMNPFKVVRVQQQKAAAAKPASATRATRKAADPTSSGGRTRKARTTAT